MSEPVVIEQLDSMMCSTPGCDHASHDGLWLHPRCHPGRGVNVLYRFGVLHVECKICKRPVVAVKVAGRLEP